VSRLTVEEHGLLHLLWADKPTVINEFSVSKEYELSTYKARKLLKGIREKGYIKLLTNKVNDGFIRQNIFTQATEILFGTAEVIFQPVEVSELVANVQNQPIGSMGSIELYSSYESIKKKHANEVRDEENDEFEVRFMPDPLLSSARAKSDWQLEQEDSFKKSALQREKEKADAWRYKQERQHESAKDTRYKKPRNTWGTQDIFYHFMDECRNHFNISITEVNKTGFVSALRLARTKYSTNGEIECRMLEILFTQIEIDQFKTADAVWKFFIYQFSQLASMAKDEYISPDQQVEYDRLREIQSKKLKAELAKARGENV